MIVKQLYVLNELGIHARVASRITRCCGKFNSRIESVKGGTRFNLKNVLSVMTMNVKCGEFIDIEVEGDDEEEAVKAVELLFAEKFGEK